MTTKISGADSLLPATSTRIEDANKILRDVQFWGRYFTSPEKSDYSPALENEPLRDRSIRVLPIARQTRHVDGTRDAGLADGQKNGQAVLAAFGADYLEQQGGRFLVFLDVEGSPPEPSLSAEYWMGWTTGLAKATEGTGVCFLPGLYVRQYDDATWVSLDAAMKQGAPCEALYVAHWLHKDGKPFPPPEWSDKNTKPTRQIDCPVYVWQYQDGASFDCDELSPALADAGIMRYLILPPGPSMEPTPEDGADTQDDADATDDIARGFATAQPLDAAAAEALYAAGYRFVIRELGTLSADEARAVRAAGLALLPCFTAEKDDVTAEEGKTDGAAAVAMARAAHVPTGVNLFCRITTPDSTSSAALIAYHEAWYQAVKSAGYVAGLAVADAKLSSEELYRKLHVQSYWRCQRGAPDVAVRGYALEPRESLAVDGAAVVGEAYGARMDQKQGSPRWWDAGEEGEGQMTGTDFFQSLPTGPGAAREQAIFDAVARGDYAPVTWVPITRQAFGHTLTIHVSADALRIGTEADSMRVSVTARTAQRIADQLGCVLPTTRICDLIWEDKKVSVSPCTYDVSDDVRQSTQLMREYHEAVEAKVGGQRGLIGDVGKNYVLSNRPPPGHVGLYGMFCDDASGCSGPDYKGPHRLIQSLGTKHDVDYVDYSQVQRLVQRTCTLDGAERDLTELMQDPALARLVSDEGPLASVRVSGT